MTGTERGQGVDPSSRGDEVEAPLWSRLVLVLVPLLLIGALILIDWLLRTP